MFSTTMLLLVAYIMIISGTNCSSYDDVQNLHAFLMRNYSKTLTPRFNQSESVDVTLDFFLNSVIDFNPASQAMTFSAVFTIEWRDEIIESRWRDSEFVNLNVTKIGLHNVWLPNVHILNTANSASVYQFQEGTLDSEMSYVTYKSTGEALITFLAVLQTTSCTTDVTNYPSDVYSCNITVVTIDHTPSINLQTTSLRVDDLHTYPNSEWTITYEVENGSSSHFPGVNFVVILSRKPFFLLLNLLFPVIILTLLNGFSFLIPIESDERLSFATSLFIVFILFLTTILDLLPSTAETFSNFNMFVFCQMFYSFFLIACIIYTSSLYHYPTTKKVPILLQKFCLLVCKRRIKLSKVDSISNINQPNNTYSENQNEDEFVSDNTQRLNWRDVSLALDTVLKHITWVVSFF